MYRSIRKCLAQHGANARLPHIAELRRLKLLEEENKKLKRLVADLSLDKVMLQDVLGKVR